MGTYVLTSFFKDGFDNNLAKRLSQILKGKKVFTYIASDFVRDQDKSEEYCNEFIEMFKNIGINFEKINIVDARLSVEEAKRAVIESDVVWLTGGHTPTQFSYLKKYGLVYLLKQYTGVIIGMSAGSINMAKLSICNLPKDNFLEIREGIGCVNISVDPHFNINDIDDSLFDLSQKYEIYGLCDESAIILGNGFAEFYGDVYKVSNGRIMKCSEIICLDE